MSRMVSIWYLLALRFGPQAGHHVSGVLGHVDGEVYSFPGPPGGNLV